MKASRYKTLADKLNLKYQALRESLASGRKKVKQSEESLQTALDAQAILQAVAAEVQQIAHDRIASIVTRCLEAVFDDPYTFKINFEQKRGKTEASMVFCRDGYEVDPRSASGGGVIEIAAFALRVAALILTKPNPRKLLVLDEPFKAVHVSYLPRVRELIEVLAEEMDIQFIIITHNELLEAGKVIQLG